MHPLGRPHRALLVPDQAVLREGRQHYLLVVNDQHRVEYRPVRLGPLYEGLGVLQEGVAPGGNDGFRRIDAR